MKKIFVFIFCIFCSSLFTICKAQFVLNGNAIVAATECSDSSTTYQLTANVGDESGQIWYATQVNLNQRFDIQFEMYLGSKKYSIGADGICFVFQQQSVNAGSNGGGLGYAGITPSLAVEFDTYQNSWDPAFCHTAIEKNGDVQHTDNSGNNLAGPVQLDPANPNLPDGNWYNMEIIWNPVTDSLSVYYNCMFRIGYKGDVIDSIFGGNPNVYWGFTAGTGASSNKQEICIAHSYLNNLRDTAICAGNPVPLHVSGGTSYSWSPDTNLSADTGSSIVATPDTTTTYTVTIKNSCGLLSSDSVTINVNPVPIATMGTQTNVLCYGANTGSATITVTGGTLPYTYTWAPSGGSNATATGLSSGTYTATATDKNGCNIKTLFVTITQPNAITANVLTDNSTCINNNGQISVSVSGGVAPYIYQWSPGGETSFLVRGLGTGSYTVTITDANGCIDTISGYIGIDKSFSVSVTGPQPDSACIGQYVTLNASGATEYEWSNARSTSSITVVSNSDTTFWVIGTTGVCSDTIPYTIKVYPKLISKMVLKDSICPGQEVKLKVSVSGGRPAYTYVWNNGITSDSPGTIIVYPATSTTYSVIVSDACNYITTDTMHVKVFPGGDASFYSTPADTIGSGQIVTFTNTSQNNTSYLWNLGDGNSSSVVSPTNVYVNTGIYQIILIGYTSHGCPDTATEEVFVKPEIYIPNVFTPNGDGVNDIIYFTVQGALCFHCSIYNRWGILIYELNSTEEGWNGTVRQTGSPAPDGTYYYILNYCDYKNDSHNLNGFISLIRGGK